MTKVCTKCGTDKPFSEYGKHRLGKHGLRPRCKTCVAAENAIYRAGTVEHRAAYNASWKREHPENHRAYNASWIERHPEATFAHRQLRNAVRRGELARPTSCESCGGTGRVHAHHDDYDKPLDVVWLCAVCHAARR
jgi:hypothetical protein